MYKALDTVYEAQHGTETDSFTEILGSWADRKGYPLVTVIHDKQHDLLNINQKQFWSDPLQPKQDGSWWIPLNIATKDNPTFYVTSANEKLSLRGEASKAVSVGDIEGFNPENWYILNVQQTGYYRVNYDEANWNRIIHQLHDDASVVHALSRAALIDDVFVLSKTGDVNYEIALELSQYLRAERDYVPWASALSHFDDLDRMIHATEISGNLMKFIAEIIHDVYVSLGTTENNGEDMLAKYARSLVLSWACRVGIEDCLNSVRAMFTKMLHEDTPVDVNLQSAVYCASLRTSTDDEYSRFMEKLAASDDQDERGRMIDALGCATDERKLMIFLESSLDKNEFVYREAEKPRVVLSVLKGNRNGASPVIKFYTENYREFLEK